MPKATIWIREENKQVWENLNDKSDWINYHLTEKRTAGEAFDDKFRQAAKSGVIAQPKPIVSVNQLPAQDNTKWKTMAVDRNQAVSKANYCEHGQTKGACLWKGCKYGR